MKWYNSQSMKNDWVPTILFVLFGVVLHGQSLEHRVHALSKAGKSKEAFVLLKDHIDRYEMAGHWDSAVSALSLKASLYERYRTPKELHLLLDSIQVVVDRYLTKDAPASLEYLLMRARIWSDEEEYDKAIDAFDYIINVFQRGRADERVGLQALSFKSFLLLVLGEVREGMALATRALALLHDSKDTFAILQAHQVMSYGADYFHQYDTAVWHSKVCLDLSKQRFGPFHPNVGITYMQIAGTYKEMGKFDLALQYYKNAMEIMLSFYRETGNAAQLAAILGNMGLLYSNLGEYHLSGDYIAWALKLKTQMMGPRSLSKLWYLNALTEVLLKAEAFGKADSINALAFRLLEANTQSTSHQRLTCASYQCEIDMGFNRTQKAYDNALQVYRLLQDEADISPKDIPYILNILARASTQLGRYQEAMKWAREYLSQVHSYYEKGHPEITNAYNSLLEVAVRSKDYSEAKKVLAAILKEKNDGSGEICFRHAIPDAHLLTTADIWSDMLQVEMEEERVDVDTFDHFIQDFTAYFIGHIAMVRSNNRLAEDISSLKRVFLPLIRAKAQNDPAEALVLVEQVKALLTRMLLQNQLVQEANGPSFKYVWLETSGNTADTGSVNRFVSEGQMLERFRAYKDSLRTHDPALYQARFGMERPSIKELRSSLPQEGVVLEYFQVDTVMYLFVLTEDTVWVRPLDYRPIDSLLDRHVKGDMGSAGRLLATLGLTDSLTKGYSSWVVLPDAKLFYLNFEALPDEQGQFLLHSKDIRYGLSIKVLQEQQRLQEKNAHSKAILGMTPGFLPSLKEHYAQRDSVHIDSSWLHYLQQPFLVHLAKKLQAIPDCHSLIGQRATEHAFKTNNGAYAVLHLGTHGVLDDHSPMFSKLVFAKDSVEDGYLYTYEIFKQQFHTKLAVLSACNTGSGAMEDGSSVFSMAQAFTHAGCPASLMTLWEVDEKSTAQILTRFYQKLEEGLTKSQALRRAKVEYLSSVPIPLQRPYYWAGLVLYGDDSPVFEKNSIFGPMQWILWVAASFVVLLLVWWMKRRNRP